MEKRKEKPQKEANEFTPLLGFLVILLVFVCWMNFGPLLSLFLLTVKPLQEGSWAILGDYFIVHAPYLLMFLALFLGSNFILKTKLRELIAGNNIRYRYVYSLVVALLYIVFLLVISLFQSRNIQLNQTPFTAKLKLLLPVLILTPMQAISEELFFRALPARLVYQNKLPTNVKNSIPIVLISGFLFLIPHMGNPEYTTSALFSGLYYFLWGAGAMALGIYSKGFEAPVAMHVANNLYIALFVNYSNSSMPTEAIFINTKLNSSIFSVIEVVIIFTLVFFLTYLLRRKAPKLLKGDADVQKEED